MSYLRTAATLALVTLVAPASAFAHRGSSKSIVVDLGDESSEIAVVLEVPDVAVSIGMPEDTEREAVLERRHAIERWLLEGLSVRGEGGACAMSLDSIAPTEAAEGPRVTARLRARCPAPARDLSLHDGTIFDDDPQHEAFVRARWGDATDTQILRRGRQDAALGQPPSVPALLGRFVFEGLVHLGTGYDHLLFLLSLILTAGGLAAREGLRAGLRDVATIVTAFTLGHSVTLLAAALGWVVLPSRLVESLIALSIALVAALNLARPRARRGMAPIAGGFGLIHGFGFSGVLAELGLPAQARVLSLVAFNVGIELGQLAFVALLLWPLAKLGASAHYERRVVRGGSIAIGLLALYWFGERALGA